MQYPLTAERRRSAMDAIARITGGVVTVISERSVGHEWAPVTRLTFDREMPGLGVDGPARTVIVKTRRVDGEGHGGPAYLRREAAGLVTGADSGVVPRMLAVDGELGVVVQSDVGEWPTLEALLLGSDVDLAASGMQQLGAAMGRLHSSTWQQWDQHEESLSRFAGTDVSTGASDFTRGTHRWDAVINSCDVLGFPDARRARNDVELLEKVVADPDACGSLVHHDLNPTNVIITDQGAWLIDFEGAGYDHFGLDVSVLHFPFPNYSAHWATIPEECAAAADRAYRDSWLGADGAGVIQDGHDTMVAYGSAISLIGRIQRLPLLARDDQSTHDSWRRRAQLVQQIEVFARLAGRAGALGDLSAWFLDLADAMAARWVDATTPAPPLFPAFGRQE